MSKSHTEKKPHPGEAWLELSATDRITYIEGVISGLNQGLRHCASETAFMLATRMPDPAGLSPENKLAYQSITQQMKTWSKSGVTVLKYSKPLDVYIETLCKFYTSYEKFRHLTPSYLMVYMDDQRNMGAEELYNLHEHSLQGFKL